MSKKPNRSCAICGVDFYGCDNCHEFKTFYPWKSLCCTQLHYQVYIAIGSLRGGVMTPKEVKEYLARINITVDEIKTFIPAVQETLLPIMEEKVVEEVVAEIEDGLTKEIYTKSKRK